MKPVVDGLMEMALVPAGLASPATGLTICSGQTDAYIILNSKQYSPLVYQKKSSDDVMAISDAVISPNMTGYIFFHLYQPKDLMFALLMLGLKRRGVKMKSIWL